MATKRLKGIVKYYLPERFCSQIVFFKNYHRFIDYKNPTIMDEKLLILKERYANDEKIKMLVDKYSVRNYLEQKGEKGILNELYQVCDNENQIEWDKLPDQFVVKCNHGSGYNVIVRNKSEMNIGAIKEKLHKWMHEDYGIISGEKQYRGIKHKIIVEKYIQSKDGHFPNDYKFFVSHGKVIGCLIIRERDTGAKRVFVDTSFSNTNFVSGSIEPNEKPACWEELVDVASRLGKDFPFVRVDLYDLDGRVLFGELTFTPHGCIHRHFSMEGQRYIGAQIAM